MADLITDAELLAVLPHLSALDEPARDSLRLAAQGALQGACKRLLAPQSIEERLDGRGAGHIRPREYPIVSVEELQIDGEGTIDPEQYRVGSGRRTVHRCNELGQEVGAFPPGIANVRIAYTIAPAAHELDLARRAVVSLVGAAEKEAERAGLAHERFEDGVSAFVALKPGEWPPIARIAMNALKRRR